MAQVTLRINGYAYTVGCQDGEEQHLQAMAAEVDRHIEIVKSMAGSSGESRMLVLAALLMADDLFEAKQALKDAEAQIARPNGAAQPDAKLGKRLGKLARRAEEIADGLERP